MKLTAGACSLPTQALSIDSTWATPGTCETPQSSYVASGHKEQHANSSGHRITTTTLHGTEGT